MAQLRLRQLVGPSDVARDREDRRFHMVLLQQRQKQRVIVVVSIVKGQDDRLFITLEVRKILKKIVSYPFSDRYCSCCSSSAGRTNRCSRPSSRRRPRGL